MVSERQTGIDRKGGKSMAKTSDLTQGKVSRLILAFFFPMLFTNMLQQVYSLADTAIVGKGLGDNALGAVGNMGSLFFLIVGFSMGLSNGFCVLIAQAFGAKDYDKMRRTTASAVKLAGAITVIMTVFSLVFLRTALVLLRTSELIINDSLLYGYIVFGGLATAIAYNLCAGILRALGDSRTPFTAIMVSTAVNIALDLFFIFVLKTGVEGAAIATVIAQIVSAAICFAKLRRIEIIRLSKADFTFDGGLYLALLKNGVPMALMNSITAVGCMVVQYFVNGLGVAYTSAYSACSKFINIFMSPAFTAGFTMSSFTSQNYGAKEYGRIREGTKVCLAIALIAYLIFGSAMVFIPRQLASLMLNGNEQISLAAQFLPITGVMLFAVDFLFVFRNGVQGMGSPLIPMCSGILEMVVRVAVIALFIGGLGFKATAYAEILAWIGALLMNASAFVFLLSRKLNEQKVSNAVQYRRQ